MSPADFAALRQRICRVHAELGAALLHLEDAESLLKDATVSALAHEHAEGAAAAFEAAAAHLADLVTAADRLVLQLAPKGDQP